MLGLCGGVRAGGVRMMRGMLGEVGRSIGIGEWYFVMLFELHADGHFYVLMPSRLVLGG